MTVLRVGCPMWAHRPWVGRFYPAGLRSGSELPYYATWCNAVEGNTTFYAEPSAATVARWLDQTPADFRFAFKLPRTIDFVEALPREANGKLIKRKLRDPYWEGVDRQI